MVKNLLKEPLLNSGAFLNFKEKGIRKLRVNVPEAKNGVRIYFLICDHCKQNKYNEKNHKTICKDICNEERNKHIILLDIHERDSAYKKHIFR